MAASLPSLNIPSTAVVINVIVPVYRGIRETKACLDSLFDSRLPKNCLVTIIDDASPEEDMAEILANYEHISGVTLIRNEKNLGFVATVNYGMTLYPQCDVVLLNSDTVVPPLWLQRLWQCAYAAENTGTVTPFSNSATICSYPKNCVDNKVPPGYSLKELDALFMECNRGESVEIPTAVGFCMYIKRNCLDMVGLFDADRFGKGYGEENDFCLRATKKRWRHLLCADLFVYHAGSVSFGNEKNERAQRALELLSERFPRYLASVHKHIKLDPARVMRHRVDLQRLINSKKAVILFVSHRLGGGVVRHERELVRMHGDKVNFLRLVPGLRSQVSLSWHNEGECLCLQFALPNDWDSLVNFLRVAGVERIHFHHLMDVPVDIERLPEVLAVPYDFTLHDYYSICPRISLTGRRDEYCGEPQESECNSCLRNAPSSQRDIRAWRAHYQTLLSGAARTLVPSKDVANRIGNYFSLPNMTVAPHADLINRALPDPAPMPICRERKLRIAVIGALSKIKGAELLEAAAIDAKRRNLKLEFHLTGYAWRKLASTPKSNLTVHGKYHDEDLLPLLKKENPDLIWFPALWPETYSYTLSAALESGTPIVAPDLGAFPERLNGRPWTWVKPWRQLPTEWNDFFEKIRLNHFMEAIPPNISASGLAVAEPDWTDAYLVGRDRTASKPSAGMDVMFYFAEHHSRSRLPLHTRLIVGMRSILLRAGLTLRSSPVLKRLIQKIPTEWQYRIRHWLVK